MLYSLLQHLTLAMADWCLPNTHHPCHSQNDSACLQNSQHERPEDVGYAVRALEVARCDCAVALQSIKVFALVAFK